MKPLLHNEIFGNWATLLLATDEHGKIDYHRLSEEIDTLIASSPNGIYSNGTAGEFYAQSEEEFDKISQLLAEKCEKFQVHFQIGVNHMSPQISLERLKRIKHLKPGAVQLILPDWFPVTLDEATVYLQRMADEANGISLVLYNPPHAKKQLEPKEWKLLKKQVPALMGVKVFDFNADLSWYRKMKENNKGLSVFIPGHHLASGIQHGAQGSYSNMACLNPYAAQRWYDLTKIDLPAALELEKRVRQFMEQFIAPFILKDHYANHACDRFMALVGNWANVGAHLRWPYRSIPGDLVDSIRKQGQKIIPEFLKTV